MDFNIIRYIALLANAIALVLDIITTDKTEKQGISESNKILKTLFGRHVKMWEIGIVYLVFFSFLYWSVFTYSIWITCVTIVPFAFNMYRFISNRFIIKKEGYDVF